MNLYSIPFFIYFFQITLIEGIIISTMSFECSGSYFPTTSHCQLAEIYFSFYIVQTNHGISNENCIFKGKCLNAPTTFDKMDPLKSKLWGPTCK
jgi:hypothetical protein